MNAIVKAHLGNQNFYTEIKAGENTLFSDEPIDLGGGNKAPNPMELLASSLASCTAITLKMYANHKEWNIGEIEVSVDIDNDRINQKAVFTRQIHFSEELEEAQRQRLLKIAESCPIHKLLHGEIEINSQLV